MTNIRYGATYVNPFPPRLGAHHALNPFRTGFTWHVSTSKGKEGTRVLNGKICNKASNFSMFYCTQDEHWTVTLQSYLNIYIKTITVRDKFVFYPQYLQLWRTYSIWDRNQSIPHKNQWLFNLANIFCWWCPKWHVTIHQRKLSGIVVAKSAVTSLVTDRERSQRFKPIRILF